VSSDFTAFHLHTTSAQDLFQILQNMSERLRRITAVIVFRRQKAKLILLLPIEGAIQISSDDR